MKHKITADTHAHFVRNIQTLKEQIAMTGKTIVKVRLRMKTFNSDYEGYQRRYVGIFWDE
jgi:hypothetical protein